MVPLWYFSSCVLQERSPAAEPGGSPKTLSEVQFLTFCQGEPCTEPSHSEAGLRLLRLLRLQMEPGPIDFNGSELSR